MGARMRIKSLRGERELAAAEFFLGLLTTDIQPDEMLVEIAVPTAKPRSGASFMEIARRRGDFALAGVAAIVAQDDAGRCSDVRLALCGVGETPIDASAAASPLLGQACRDDAIEAVAANVQKAITPSGNVHASPDYQRHIAGVLTKRAIKAAHHRVAHAA
jgi:carbon-monoxide dehydrogenase medium subunit